MRIIAAGIAFLLCPLLMTAQDSSRRTLRFTHEFELQGRQHLYNMYSRVSMPATIREGRQNTTALPTTFDSVTDNPFKHGAMYAAYRATISLRNKITARADLYGEYRGFSYGTNNVKNNLLLYPVLSIHAMDTLQVGKAAIIVDGKVGQFLNEKTGEGWMIYNLDVQGTQARVRYRNHRIGFTIYGDLMTSIGLGIDDLKEFTYEHLLKNDSARFGVSMTIANPPYAPVKYHSYFSAFGSLLTKNGMRLYLQGGFTTTFDNFPRKRRRLSTTTGAVAGVEHQLMRGKLSWKNNVEVRYYGSLFNMFHSQPGTPYRDSARNEYEMYANTTGEYLYPLRKFDTPFSQWAVFTEYFNHNVFGISATGTFQYAVNKKLGLLLDYDVNMINAVLDKELSPYDVRSVFIYPFFKTGLQYHPVPEVTVGAYLTNKSMNLDVYYPTHYLHRKPFVGLEIHCKI